MGMEGDKQEKDTLYENILAGLPYILLPPHKLKFLHKACFYILY